MSSVTSAKTPARSSWQTTARRIRVPLGFAVAIVFLVFAKPSWILLRYSLILVLPGLWLRAYAAGYVKKNSQLTRTGPYAYTRNPLYLGSMGIAFGFVIASGKWWLAVLLAVMFALIYIPTILAEEAFLKETFQAYREYKARVPRLRPRLRPARFTDYNKFAGGFSGERYLHHREYNALMGAAAIYALLIAKMLFLRGHA